MERLTRSLFETPVYPERILQIGEGNFLRAFVCWMVQEMNEKADFKSSIVVTQPLSQGMVPQLNEQDGLYTLVLKGLDKGKPVRIIKRIECISRGINPFEHNDEFMQLACSPDMRFVISNTTEAGIAFDTEAKETECPPQNFPARMTKFLYHRFEAFKGAADKGLIFIPCELIEQNGDHLKEHMLHYAQLWHYPASFVEWMNSACAFANTLVDRIVPGYPRDTIAEITEEVQYEDKMVVEGEIFHLWVIEAPAWVEQELPTSKAGLNVLFVPSIKPYRDRKVTLLNGPHTVLSPVAYLAGLNTVREACEDAVVGKYVRKAMYDELIPTLDLSKEELTAFADSVMERFCNPYVNHLVTSIMLNSFPKFKTRDLPALKKYLERKGQLPDALVFGLAAIISYYKGGKRGEDTIVLNDDPKILDLLSQLWQTNDPSTIAEGVLGASFIWAEDLNSIAGLKEKLTGYLTLISQKGMNEALQTIV